MWKEFKKFAFKGNVLDMAVGVMIGAAFNKIVSSVVNDLFMPLLSWLTGRVDFSKLYLPLDGKTYESYDAAVEAAAPMFKYGAFIQTVIDFALIAVCVFFFVRGVNRIKDLADKKEAPAPAPAPRLCPYCRQTVDKDATRCPHCTSELPKEE